MKKIIVLLFLLFCTIPVFAEDKVLILEEVKNHYYYDRHSSIDLFQQEIKMNELKPFVSELEIQNNSDLNKEVFLLFESKGQDGSYNDLMAYLDLKITLDDKVVYEGSGEPLDYSPNSNDLHDYISIGKLNGKSTSHLKIEMNVSEEYTSVSDNSFAYVMYSFYQKEKKEYIEIEELTPDMLYNFLDVWVFCGVCVLFAVLILSLVVYRIKTRYKKKEKKEKKKKKKKKDGEEEVEEEKEEETK